MRPIKFRAWDKSEGRMILDAHLEYDTITETRYADAKDDMDKPSECSFGDYLKNDEYVVEQFTGLHDRNGKEIYEGDILGYENSADIDVVYFDEGGFRVRDACSGGTDFLAIADYGSMVIGNIHENPDLLEDA